MGGRGASSGSSKGSASVKKSVEYYVSGEGMWINNYLRGRGDFGELTQQEKQLIHDLDVATKSQIKDKYLYRNVDASAIFGDITNSDFENMSEILINGKEAMGKGAYADSIRDKTNKIINNAKGKTITEKGYMSTTTDPQIAEGWGDFTGAEKPIVLKIKTNKNTTGYDVGKRFDTKDSPQQEKLLARGQKYSIDNVYGKNGSVYVDVILKNKKSEVR